MDEITQTDTSGFYKKDGTLLYARNRVLNANYALHRSNYLSYEYPVDGWKWFENETDAKAFFEIVDGNESFAIDPSTAEETIEQVTKRLILAIQKKRDELTFTGGHKIGNHWFHSDAYSLIQQLSLNNTADKMIAAGASDDDFVKNIPWKTMGGSFVALTVGLAKQFAESAGNQQIQLFGTTEVKIDNLKNLTIAEMLDYDVDAGWPETYKPST